VGVGAILVAAGAWQGVKARDAADTINGLFARGGQWDSHYRAVEADGRHANSLALAFSITGGVVMLGGAALAWMGWRERALAARPTSVGRGAVLSFSCGY
jgi:hypothetical protein